MKSRLNFPDNASSSFLIALLLIFSSCRDDAPRADAYGNFEASELLISAKTQGELLHFNVHKGDFLVAGDTVGIIDTSLLVLQKNQLNAKQFSLLGKIDEVEAQIHLLALKEEFAARHFKRLDTLLSSAAASVQQWDQARLELSMIKQQIEQARVSEQSIWNEKVVLDRQMDVLERQLKDCYLINPIDGVVLDKYLLAHELAFTGKPIYSIANLDTLELKAYVGASYLSQITLGQIVEVAVDGPKGLLIYPGTIEWIASRAEFTPKVIQTAEDRINLVYAIKIRVPNDGKLKIAMPGEVYFTSHPANN